MLGCQDFCGYYDWTFRHVADRYGRAAVRQLWAEAIGGESQSHYLKAALSDGLHGLFRTWVKTGEEETCDWTFTLDETRNVLRWDMRRCPSKGFLLGHDLNACEDYCDHCMGWIVPLLKRAGMEVCAHEHNHCGQCWAEMRVRGRPFAPPADPPDVRRDPRWRHGYVERWEEGVKVRVAPTTSEDPAEAVRQVFAGCRRLVIVSDAEQQLAGPRPDDVGVLVADSAYAKGGVDARAVLIGAPPEDLPAISRRYFETPLSRRPTLLYSYPPALPPVDFVSSGLPRPLPVLPLLIRQGVYRHQPGEPMPETRELMVLLARALGCEIEEPEPPSASTGGNA